MRKQKDVDRLTAEKKTQNRGSDIVLDVNSILDQLMGPGGFDGSSADEEIEKMEPVKPKSSQSRSPNLNQQTSPSRTKIDEELPIYSLRSNRSKAAAKAVEASFGNKDREEVGRFDKKPPISPRNQPMNSAEEETSSKTNSVVKRRQSSEIKPRPLSPKQQAPPEFSVSREEEKQMKTRGLVSQTHRRKDEGLTNGHVKEEEKRGSDDEEDFRMRVRSNAVNKYDRLKVHALKDIKQEMLEEEKQQVKVRETPRGDTVTSSRRKSRPTSNLESPIGRSGSFSRRQRIAGDKALGMFYHSRHSQFDLDTLEESEKNLRGSSLERSGSFSDPRSPTSQSRDSRSFSPRDHDGSFSPIPQSPLVSTGLNFEVGSGDRNEKSREGVTGKKEGGGVRPVSPRVTVQNEEDEPEVSGVCKQVM